MTHLAHILLQRKRLGLLACWFLCAVSCFASLFKDTLTPHDNIWRLQTLNASAGQFIYQYPASSISPLVSGITLPNFASITNHYDSLSRLDFTALQNYWGHVLDGYTYGMDALGLRTNITRDFGLTTNSVAVSYDPISQITGWFAKESSGTPRQNEQLAYNNYDAAENLHSRTNGLLIQIFNNDAVNQISNITRSGTLTVTGAIPAPATNITVNGSTAALYGDLTFASTNNSLSNGTNTFTIIAQNVYGTRATNNLSVNLPTNVTALYDANGNVTNDSTRSFVFNAENQLTNVFIPVQWKIEFVHDGLGRRRIMREYAWQSGAWLRTNETRLICDGMVPVQERDSNNAVRVTYTRGLDLSLSLQGAGGIGGLLARTDSTNGSTFYHADGPGNITALMDGYQDIVERNLFDPFGQQLGQWGPMAGADAMGYSSMPKLGRSGLVGFPLREYDPFPIRFTSKDPIGEAGGLNLYGFVGNTPLNSIDPLGLWWAWTYSWMPIRMANWLAGPPIEAPARSAPSYSNLQMLADDLGSENYDTTHLHAAANALQTAAELNPIVGTYDDSYGAMQGKDAVTYDPLSRGDRLQKGSAAAATLLPFGKLAKPCKEAVEDTIRIRHYTNIKGLKGIEESGIIRASDQNRVFAESARRNPLSQVEAEANYGLKEGRGRNFVETDVPKSQVSQRFNPQTGANELIIKGDVPLQNPTFTKRP